jgi:hypothetical protein
MESGTGGPTMTWMLDGRGTCCGARTEGRRTRTERETEGRDKILPSSGERKDGLNDDAVCFGRSNRELSNPTFCRSTMMMFRMSNEWTFTSKGDHEVKEWSERGGCVFLDYGLAPACGSWNDCCGFADQIVPSNDKR